LDRATYTEEISPLEPTVLAAMWRYRWLVLASVAGAAVLSLVYSGTRPTEYEATASLVVEDPRESGVFQSLSGARPERYVADQVEILRSTVVAQRASEIGQGRLASADLSIDDLLDNTEPLPGHRSRCCPGIGRLHRPRLSGRPAVGTNQPSRRGVGAPGRFTGRHQH
jgi:hypothetical protein